MPYTSDGTPYVGGSDTSAAAAQSQRGKKRVDELRILDCLWDNVPGLTTDEISVLLRMPIQTASARVTGLKADGLVYIDADKRITRNGRQAHVNYLTLAAINRLKGAKL